jgi:hypothetical protein
MDQYTMDAALKEVDIRCTPQNLFGNLEGFLLKEKVLA